MTEQIKSQWSRDNRLNLSLLAVDDAMFQLPIACRMYCAHMNGLALVWQSMCAAAIGVGK